MGRSHPAAPEHIRSLTGATDEQLWRRTRRGDEHAFGLLFDRHADDVFRYGQVRLRSREAAQDLVSYVFTEAWRQRHRIELQDGSLRPWLFGVARNRSARLRRRALDRPVGAGSESSSTTPDHADRVVEQLESQDRCRAVLAALDALPAPSREVLSLAVWGGLTYEQIATELDIEVGTVKSRLSRARRRLAPVVDPGRAPSSTSNQVISLFTPEDTP